MSKKPAVTASGAVCFREKHGDQQVLIVHRPAYDDWSFPKGKLHPDEDLPAAAVRETFEETGAKIRLGLRLNTLRYSVSKGKKAAHYWVGHLLDQKPRKPDKEVDKVKWVDIKKAHKLLTYSGERELLDQALAHPITHQVLVVRHAKAMLRKHWDGNDQKRPLNARGRRQSKRLVQLLAAYQVEELISSASKRCVQTFQPYAKAHKLHLVKHDLLTEETAERNEEAVKQFMADLALMTGSPPVAVCGHRPVLPAMFEGLNVKPKHMLTAETVVVHVDGKGRVITTENHKSAF